MSTTTAKFCRINPYVVNEYRFKNNISQSQLAKMAGINQPMISRLLSPHHARYTGATNFGVIAKIARVLNLDPATIMLPDNAPVPAPEINPDGTVSVLVAGSKLPDGTLRPGYIRPIRFGAHNKNRSVAASRRATAAAKPAVAPTYGDPGFVHHYDGKASRLLVVTGGEHKIYDLSKAQVFYIK